MRLSFSIEIKFLFTSLSFLTEEMLVLKLNKFLYEIFCLLLKIVIELGLKIKTSLQHLNKSVKNEITLTQEQKDRIYNLYQIDFQTFNYDK